MGGPGASVLVRKTLTKQQENELEIWLRSMTHDLEKNGSVYEFWLNADAFPGNVSQCLFYLSLSEAKAHWDEDERKHLCEHGFRILWIPHFCARGWSIPISI